MKKSADILINITIVFLLCMLAYSGYRLYGNKQEGDKTRQQYEKLEQIVQNDETEETTYATTAEKYQSVYDMNNDFIGWIYIPDTPLSYPVMQTKNDPEYYLRRDFEENYSSYGVPFMDYKCDANEGDTIVIYGHNMLNKTMFSAVESYASKSYWEQHKYIGFDTMAGFGTYEVVVSARIDLANTDYYYNAYPYFANEAEFNDFIAKAKAASTYSTGVNTGYGDQLLLLSTCEFNYEDGRYIVIAKKVSDTDLSKMQ